MSPDSYEVGFVPKYELESCNLFCGYQLALEGYDKVGCLKTPIHIAVHVTNKNVHWEAVTSVKPMLEFFDTLIL